MSGEEEDDSDVEEKKDTSKVVERCKYYDKYKDESGKKDMRWEVKDIEDLLAEGKSEVFCPYYLQMDRARQADIILMPYMYLINSQI